ncbi:hypothetical protein JCM10449v2_005347 [Rhodotorula kratochvilovae]
MPSHAELTVALKRYPAALKLRAAASKASADLVELDGLARIKAEKDGEGDAGARLTKEELVRLMDWKLARGKFRPRLQSLVASNSASSLRSAISSAAGAATLENALKELSKLSAVGPATASAVLALWYPEEEPFMSDEAMDGAEAFGEGEPGGKGKREYTVKAWRGFREQMMARKEKEGWQSMEDLERALWSWAVERRYGGKDEEEAGAEEQAPKKPAKKRSGDAAAPATKKRKSTCSRPVRSEHPRAKLDALR